MDRNESMTMTVEQAGSLLGISRRSAYRAAAAGHIPTIRLGRRLLVPIPKLQAMLGIGVGGTASAGESKHAQRPKATSE